MTIFNLFLNILSIYMALICNAFTNINSICVNTGEVLFDKKPLTTSFVKTCSVITFKYNSINFLAHIYALDPLMKQKVKKKINELNPKNIDHIYIWEGSRCNGNCPSFKLAKDIVSNLTKNIVIKQANENIIISN